MTNKLPQRKLDEPCRATFHISCLLTAPLDNGEWLPIGTLNDSFICELTEDVSDDKELKMEVYKKIRDFKQGMNNVVSLENLVESVLKVKEKENEKQNEKQNEERGKS